MWPIVPSAVDTVQIYSMLGRGLIQLISATPHPE
jgi:hypothetical protein